MLSCFITEFNTHMHICIIYNNFIEHIGCMEFIFYIDCSYWCRQVRRIKFELILLIVVPSEHSLLTETEAAIERCF